MGLCSQSYVPNIVRSSQTCSFATVSIVYLPHPVTSTRKGRGLRGPEARQKCEDSRKSLKGGFGESLIYDERYRREGNQNCGFMRCRRGIYY